MACRPWLADHGLQTYFNAWTKSNQTLSSEYILKHVTSPRVSILYSYDASIPTCLTTKGCHGKTYKDGHCRDVPLTIPTF